jgi:hypothetical protein
VLFSSFRECRFSGVIRQRQPKYERTSKSQGRASLDFKVEGIITVFSCRRIAYRMKAFVWWFAAFLILELSLYGLSAAFPSSDQSLAFFPIFPAIFVAMAIGGVHSAGLISFAVGIVVTAVVYALVAWAPVRLFKRKIGGRAYWLVPIPFVIVVLLGFLLSYANAPNTGPPTFLRSGNLAGLIKALPDYAPFGYDGLSFYKGKLYASTNVGLVEIDGEHVNGIYRFQRSDSVVSGPWLDIPDQLLWTLDVHANELVNFDGTVWHRVKFPQPQKGYLTRGDVLQGPRPIGNAKGFWLEAGGSVWRWNAAMSKWMVEERPPNSPASVSEVIGVLPIGEKLLFIERHELLPFLIKPGENFASDTVDYGKGGWHTIQNDAGFKFLAEEWAVTDDAGYICSRDGVVLKVTSEKVTKLDAPGSCEALASTLSNSLLVSFRDQGIYEYKQNWELRAAQPYSSAVGDYWAYLRADGPRIALALHGKSVMSEEPSDSGAIRFTRKAPSRLWVYQASEFHSIPIP